MALQDNFCSSPWFHTRINNSGDYETCRSADRHNLIRRNRNIRTVSPVQWFQKDMAPMRQHLLSGREWSECSRCHDMERYQKVSLREKQLLKTGINLENFEKTLRSSPWIQEFRNSSTNGTTDLMPQDWQIDLGNYCNSACIMCDPRWSSSLATEFAHLGLNRQTPGPNWANDTELVDKFVDAISTAPLRYLHFLGGETLLIPAFRRMLEILRDQHKHQAITVGFTTNATVWRQDVVDLLCEFGSVHVGTSVECLHALNDYVRYPSRIDLVRSNLDQWLETSREQGWLMSLRITPTCLSIWHVDTIFDWAWDHAVPVESCDFLTHPEHLKINLLPQMLRISVIERLQQWIQRRTLPHAPRIVNTRHPDQYQQQLVQDVKSYIQYLENAPDESHRTPSLIHFLKQLESSRKNRILDYLPEYEQFLRSFGY